MESRRFEDYVFSIEFTSKSGAHALHNFGKSTKRGVRCHTSYFFAKVKILGHPARRYRINRNQNQTSVLFVPTNNIFTELFTGDQNLTWQKTISQISSRLMQLAVR